MKHPGHFRETGEDEVNPRSNSCKGHSEPSAQGLVVRPLASSQSRTPHFLKDEGRGNSPVKECCYLRTFLR